MKSKSWQQKRRNYFASDLRLGVLFVLPAFLILLLFVAYPLFYSVYLGFTDKTVGSRNPNFIGLKNFIDLASIQDFRQVLLNTFVYAGGAVLGKVVVGVLIALLLTNEFWGRDLVRGLSFIPWITPMVAAGISLRWIFDDMFGVVNEVLLRLGIIEFPIAWLGSPLRAKVVTIIANIWKGVPFFIMSYLAVLQTIPNELYEAAEMDGATSFEKFLHITLPTLRGVILLTSTISIISTVNDFTTIFMITNGGPGNATETVATYTYRTAFMYNRLGRGTAASLFFFPLYLVLIIWVAKTIFSQQD